MNAHKDPPKRPPADFVAWLWSKKHLDRAFFPSTLTEDNKDDTLPRPALSQPESEEVFRHLDDLKLVFPVAADGGTAYSINKLKPHEWDDAERELRKPKWKRSKTLAKGLKVTGYILSLIVAGFIGGVSRKAADDFYDARKAKVAAGDAVAPKVAELKGKEADKQKTRPPSDAPKDEAKK